MQVVKSIYQENNATNKEFHPATTKESSSESETEPECFNPQEVALIALPGLEHMLCE
jgi:hypothetical protein